MTQRRCVIAIGDDAVLPRALPVGQSRLTSNANYPYVDAGLPVFVGSSTLPESRRRTRLIQVAAVIALAMTIAYLTWRTVATINPDAWPLSVVLLLLELHAFLGLVLFTFSLWEVDSVSPARPVDEVPGKVAVLIPTYNESMDVLLPTIAAAVAIRLPHETWVLDDGRRPEIEQLAKALGASYLTRPTNEHAKAGNINHALRKIDADFIAVLDADHVATPDFLRHTLGYFADPGIALVQTPQDFYNVSSFEHDRLPQDIGKLSAEHRQMYHEQTLFYRVIQPAKNRWGGAFWCGTRSVVRVAALRSVGGVATDTITEDIHTTVRLHRRGWRTVYHNEVLARGLAASSADQYQLQRYRWGTGAMQLLRLENPLFVKGLSIGQRLSYMKTLLGWFDSWRTLGYLLMPPLVLLTGQSPIVAPASQFLVIFLLTFVIQRAALRLLSRGYFQESLQIVFEIVRMTPNLLATLTLVRRKPHTFRVTPKGRVGDERHRIGPPSILYSLVALSLFTAVWFVLTLAGLSGMTYEEPWVAYGAAFWLVFNGVFVIKAIRRVRSPRFATERRAGVRFDTELDGVLGGVPCRVLDLSLNGARVSVDRGAAIPEAPVLWIGSDALRWRVPAEVRLRRPESETTDSYGLRFTSVHPIDRARIALALFNHHVITAFDAEPLAAD
jgi:cellulose synthase (UDP-forming)